MKVLFIVTPPLKDYYHVKEIRFVLHVKTKEDVYENELINGICPLMERIVHLKKVPEQL